MVHCVVRIRLNVTKRIPWRIIEVHLCYCTAGLVNEF